MDKKLFMKVLMLQQPLMTALSLLIEIIVLLISEEILPGRFWLRCLPSELVHLMAKEVLCIIIEKNLTSMVEMVSSEPKFQLVLVYHSLKSILASLIVLLYFLVMVPLIRVNFMKLQIWHIYGNCRQFISLKTIFSEWEHQLKELRRTQDSI